MVLSRHARYHTSAGGRLREGDGKMDKFAVFFKGFSALALAIPVAAGAQETTMLEVQP